VARTAAGAGGTEPAVRVVPRPCTAELRHGPVMMSVVERLGAVHGGPAAGVARRRAVVGRRRHRTTVVVGRDVDDVTLRLHRLRAHRTVLHVRHVDYTHNTPALNR